MEDSNNPANNNPNITPQGQPSVPPLQPAQPTTPTPDIALPTYKTPHDPKMVRVIAGGIVAIVMIIGLSIFLTALNRQTGQGDDDNTTDTSSGSSKKEESYLTENEKQAKVKKILNEIKTAATDTDEIASSITDNSSDAFAENDISEDDILEDSSTSDATKLPYSIQDVYDSDNPLYFVSGAKVPTFLNKSFGFVVTAPDQPELIKQMSENAKAKLKKLGFATYKDAGEDISGAYGWLNSNDKIVCTPLRDNLITFSLSCGHTSWIPSEKVALVNSLATAYIKKEGELPLYINALPDEIEDSPYEPYQKLVATLPDSAGLFYRASSDTEWVYFLGTQTAVPCSKYYADAGAKHAFQGDTCLAANGELAKVKETVTEEDKTSVEEDEEE